MSDHAPHTDVSKVRQFDHPGRGRQRARATPKGRQVDPHAKVAIEALLGDGSRQRDLLIEYLHLIQDTFGQISADHLAALADEMSLAFAEVFETATFYAHFDVIKEGEEDLPRLTVRVCDSLTCAMFGGEELLATLQKELGPGVRVTRAPCVGLCDVAPAVEVGHHFIHKADLAKVKSAIGHGHIHPEIPDYIDHDQYVANGGYQILGKLRAGDVSIEDVLKVLDDGALRGLGGAGFPTGRKWRSVRGEPGPRLMAVNGDEGEPGTFKDQLYLNTDPHRFLEGMLIGAYVVEASDVYIYLRDEYPISHEILKHEIAALPPGGPTIHLRRGAGAYICGEESSLIESLEGKRGLPRQKPPFPFQVGLFGRPTLINNVETLFWIRDLIEKGPDWWKSQGRNGRSGLRSYSVSGRVKEPGVKLAPSGVTIQELVDEFCGGMAEGHTFTAYLPGGASGGILPAAMNDIPLDFGTLEKYGCFIGSAAVVVLSDQDDVRGAALNLMRFFEDESCGQCTPCRVGTQKAVALMQSSEWDTDLLDELSACMRDASICGLGQAASNPLSTVIKYFPDLFPARPWPQQSKGRRSSLMTEDKNPKDLKADVKQDEGGKPASNPQGGSAYAQGAQAGGQQGVISEGPVNKKATAQAAPPGIAFELDGMQVEAAPGETIWQVAKRMGTHIPHLCHKDARDYRPDGNCRACMVEIEGERVLAASCRRTPGVGMKVKTQTERATKSRAMVLELLVADQPERAISHDPDSHFWSQADFVDVSSSRFPSAERWAGDHSHPAMRVNLDACIQCNLCVRACREVQVNDVIGMAYRSHGAKIVFDFDDPMGQSTCVACGECVQACPTGALMPAAYLNEVQTRTVYPDREVASLCPYCGVGCQLSYKVKDEKIIYAEGIDGPANHNRLCVKGRFGFDYIHHPHRLTKPLIRLDGVAKDPNDQVDPANPWTHFREATWEEALDRAAGGLKKIRDTKGKKALAGFGSAKGSNEEAYLFQKLVRLGFGSNNVDHCTRLCHASSVAALMEGLNSGAVSAPFAAAMDAEVIIVIGANPTVNHPVAATFIKNAVKKNGAKLIVMDPRRQTLSRHAYKHLAFKNGTDVAMLNAMLNTIITEKLYDEQYIAAYTENFEALKESIKDFTPEAMATVCGIDAETLKEVARLYAKSQGSIIFWGMGISQHVHGTDNSRCLIALALTTGQIGRKGTGLHPLRGQNNVQGASDAGLIPMVYPDYQSVEKAEVREMFETFWGQKLDPQKGLTVVEIMNAVHAGEITGMYVEGENPAMSDPDLNHARGALAKLDHLVVQDLFLTETAFHADVVLPASAFAEKSGTFTNTDRRVQLARPVVKPPGDARQDLWIIQEMGKRLDLDWTYEGPADVFAEMAMTMPSFNNITWERLEREGAVTYPVDGPDQPGNEIIFYAGFPTDNGRAKIVPAAIRPPDEVPDFEFPMILSTGRVLEHWHTGSMTRRAGVLDALEPEAVAFMAPRELYNLGLTPGDLMRLETRRGAVNVKVRSDRDVPVGMIFMPFCYAEAAANLLTNPALDPMGKIPEFKFCAARVAPVTTAVAAE